MKKGRIVWAAAAAACVLAAGGCAFGGGKESQEENTSIRVGMLLYRGDDTFISTLRSAFEEQAKEYEQDTGIKVKLDIMDAKSSQLTQNNQVDRLISLGCDVLCVNTVDRAAASVIIDKAMAEEIPLVFFNREPVGEDMNRWEKLYYVGIDAKESAVLQGEIVVDLYNTSPQELDRNQDGLVSYVLLEGESSHQDSLIRTEWSVETLKEGGIPLERLTGGIANWERSQASALMEQWLEQYPNKIELVICNNDDMALGAIDALKRAKIDKGTIKLVGIDGVPAGLDAVKEGYLLGTVESDKKEYASAVFSIAVSLSAGEDPGEILPLSEGKYYWSSQRKVTKDILGGEEYRGNLTETEE